MRVPLSPAIGGGWTRPHPDQLRDLPHWVYRIYDVDNELLYVGCTYLEPEERIKALRNHSGSHNHLRDHHWHAQRYPDMTQALAVEGMWIDVFAPPKNGMRSGVAARRQLTVDPKPAAQKSGLVPWLVSAVSTQRVYQQLEKLKLPSPSKKAPS